MIHQFGQGLIFLVNRYTLSKEALISYLLGVVIEIEKQLLKDQG
jgi:hypothetical protein